MYVANVASSDVAATRSSQLLRYASYDAVEFKSRALRGMSQPLAEGLRQACSFCSQNKFAGQQHLGDIKSIFYVISSLTP